MKRKVSDYLVNMIIENGIVTEKDREIYAYGISQGIVILQNIFITIFIGALLGNIYQTVVFLCSYIPLRSFAGGYHALSERKCFWNSIALIIIIQVYFTYYQLVNFKILLVTVFLSLIVIYRIAPMQSPNKVISEMESKFFKQKINKIMFMQVVLCLISIIYEIESVQSGIFINVIVVAFLLILGKILNIETVHIE